MIPWYSKCLNNKNYFILNNQFTTILEIFFWNFISILTCSQSYNYEFLKHHTVQCFVRWIFVASDIFYTVNNLNPNWTKTSNKLYILKSTICCIHWLIVAQTSQMLEMILQRMCHSQKNLLIKNERFFIVALETFLVWIQVLTSFFAGFQSLGTIDSCHNWNQ